MAEDDETSSLGQLFDEIDSGDEMTEDVDPRVIMAARQLQASYNPLANEILGTIIEPQTGRDEPYPTRANVAAGLVHEIENYKMELPKKLNKNVTQ